MSKRFSASTMLFLALIIATSSEKAVSQQPASLPAGDITLTHWGAAGWAITDGRIVILVDPYLSRLRVTLTAAGTNAPDDSRPVFGPDDPLRPDTAAIDAHLRSADFILIHHSHFDHLLDVAYIARKTGATVLGTESTINLLRASGVPEEKLLTVRGGADYDFSIPTSGTACQTCAQGQQLSIRVIPSIHSALRLKHYFDSRTIPPNVQLPLRRSDYAEGGSLMYLIRLGGREILTAGGMNYIEREIEGLRPDVVLAGAGESRQQIYEYAGRLMRALGNPPLVLPTHWDNYGVPFTDPRAMRAGTTPGDNDVLSFVNEIRAASPTTQVIVPRYFEPISLRGVAHAQRFDRRTASKTTRH